MTNETYRFCHREPLARDFGLRDQLQRAAVSVMNNVAEGWESLHVAEKRQAYNIARKSCGEVHSALSYVLFDNKFINATEQGKLQLECIQTGKLISGLIRSLGNRGVKRGAQMPDPGPQIQEPRDPRIRDTIPFQ